MSDSHWGWLLRNPILDLVREQDALFRSIQDAAGIPQRVLDEMASRSAFDVLHQHVAALAAVRENSLGFLEQANRFSDLIDSHAIQTLTSNHAQIPRLAAASRAFGHLDDANQSFIRMLGSGEWARGITEVSEIHKGWQSQLEVLTSLPGATALETLLSSELARLAELSAAAENSMSRMPMQDLTASLGESVSASFASLMQSYCACVREFEVNPSLFASAPPVVTRTPPREVALNTWALEAIWCREDAGQSREKRVLPPIEPDAVLDRLPSSSVERYLPLLNGAKAAVRSGNPDRVRHVTTSLRELIGHLLRDLAPDDEVMNWGTEGEHLADGRPTRRGRVLYLCRNLASGSFAAFVNHDVAAVLELIQILHSGVHKIDPGYNDLQLRTLVRRTEWFVLFLVELKEDGG